MPAAQDAQHDDHARLVRRALETDRPGLLAFGGPLVDLGAALAMPTVELMANSDEALLALAETQHGTWRLAPDPADPPNEAPPEESVLLAAAQRPEGLEQELAQLRWLDRRRRGDGDPAPLALGLWRLDWVEAGAGVRRCSPLVLAPVELAGPPWRVRRAGEAAANPALGLAAEPDEGPPAGAGPAAVLAWAEALASGRDGWRVRRQAWLVAVPRNAALLALGAAAVGAELASDRRAGALVAPQLPGRLLRAEREAAAPAALELDGGQQAALAELRAGGRVVVTGPPGVGKTQTAVAAAVDALARDRSVLYLADHAAGLDAAAARLGALGLAALSADLRTAGDPAAAAALRRRAREPLSPPPRLSAADRARLSDAAAALTEARAASVERRPPGVSLAEVWTALLEEGAVHGLVAAALAPAEHAAALEALAELSAAGATLRRGTLWAGLDPAAIGPDGAARDEPAPAFAQEARAAAALAGAALAALAELEEARDRAAQLLGASEALDALAGVEALAVLADAVAAGPGRAPLEWLSAPGLAPLRDAAGELRAATVAYHQAVVDAAGSLEGAWKALDPAWGEEMIEVLAAAEEAAEQDDEPSPPLWSPGERHAEEVEDTAELLAASVEMLDGLEVEAEWLALRFGFDGPLGPRQAAELGELAALAAAAQRPEAAWFAHDDLDELERAIAALSGAATEFQHRRRVAGGVWKEEALALDLGSLALDLAAHQGVLGKLNPQGRAARSRLAAVVRRGQLDDEALARLPDAVAWQRAAAALREMEEQHAGLLGPRYTGPGADFGALRDAVDVVRRARRLAAGRTTDEVLAARLARPAEPGEAGAAEQDRNLGEVGQHVEAAARRWLGFAAALAEGRLVEDPAAEDPAVHALLAEAPLAVLSRWCSRSADAAGAAAALTRQVGLALGRPVTAAEALAAVELVEGVHLTHRELDATARRAQGLLGALYPVTEEGWAGLDEALDWAEGVRAAHGGPLPPPLAARVVDAAARGAFTGAPPLSEALEAWNAAATALRRRFDDAAGAAMAERFALSLTAARASLEALNADEEGAFAVLTARAAQEQLDGLAARSGLLADALTPLRRLAEVGADLTPLLDVARWAPWAQAQSGLDRTRLDGADDEVRARYRALHRVARRDVAASAFEAAVRRRGRSSTALARLAAAAAPTTAGAARALLAKHHEAVVALAPCTLGLLEELVGLGADREWDLVVLDLAEPAPLAVVLAAARHAHTLLVAGPALSYALSAGSVTLETCHRALHPALACLAPLPAAALPSALGGGVEVSRGRGGPILAELAAAEPGADLYVAAAAEAAAAEAELEAAGVRVAVRVPGLVAAPEREAALVWVTGGEGDLAALGAALGAARLRVRAAVGPEVRPAVRAALLRAEATEGLHPAAGGRAVAEQLTRAGFDAVAAGSEDRPVRAALNGRVAVLVDAELALLAGGMDHAERALPEALERRGWLPITLSARKWLTARAGELARLEPLAERAASEAPGAARRRLPDAAATVWWAQPYQAASLDLAELGAAFGSAAAGALLAEQVMLVVDHEAPVHGERVVRTVLAAYGLAADDAEGRPAVVRAITRLADRGALAEDDGGILRGLHTPPEIVRLPTDDPATHRPVAETPVSELARAVHHLLEERPRQRSELAYALAGLYRWPSADPELRIAVDHIADWFLQVGHAIEAPGQGPLRLAEARPPG